MLRPAAILYLHLLSTAMLLAVYVAARQTLNTNDSHQYGPQDGSSCCWNDVVSVFVKTCTNVHQSHTSVTGKRYNEQTPLNKNTTGETHKTTKVHEEMSTLKRDSQANNIKAAAQVSASAAESSWGFTDFWPEAADDTAFDFDAIMEQAKQAIESKFQKNSEKRSSDEEDFRLNERFDNGDDFVYPKLTRLNAGKVGDIKRVELEDGMYIERVTRSTRPVVFEFANFLSGEECGYIIERAEATGLNRSALQGADVNKEFADGRKSSEISRYSETAVFRTNTSLSPEFLKMIQKRISKLTNLPIGVIERSEPIQVARYQTGGHYHAHLDSEHVGIRLPCCFHTPLNRTQETAGICRVCRFATFLYYLNDVDQGGETAFPLSGVSFSQLTEKMEQETMRRTRWHNLSDHCYEAPLVITPQRGKAIFWYNHYLDPQTGYLGEIDARTQHGGCDVITGTKWIATNWILAPTYKERFKGSRNFVKP